MKNTMKIFLSAIFNPRLLNHRKEETTAMSLGEKQ